MSQLCPDHVPTMSQNHVRNLLWQFIYSKSHIPRMAQTNESMEKSVVDEDDDKDWN